MDNSINKIQSEIIKSLKAIEDNNWIRVELNIQFPPFTNKGYNIIMKFQDKDDKILRVRFNLSDDFDDEFFDFWRKNENKYNQIDFFTRKNDYENSKIEILFNKEIDDEFQNSLPKSKRGKTIPWYVSEKFDDDKIV